MFAYNKFCMKSVYSSLIFLCALFGFSCGPSESEIADIALLKYDSIASLNQKQLVMEMTADSAMAREEIEMVNKQFLSDHLNDLKSELENFKTLLVSLDKDNSKSCIARKNQLTKKMEVLSGQILEIENELK